jgi:hypothetical protein
MVVACVSGSRYFDLDAVREASKDTRPRNTNGPKSDNADPASVLGHWPTRTTNPPGAPPLDWWDPVSTILGEELRLAGEKIHAGASMATLLGDGTDGRRETLGSKTLRRLVESGLIETGDAIAMPPDGYKGAHYAVFPSAFVEPWIKAMSPERVCVECGEPSRRIVETEQFYRSTGQPTDGKRAFTTGASINAGLQDKQHGATTPLGHDSSVERRVIGERWSDCGHNAWRPGLVLDPFAGSGTTLSVATGHGRDAIGIDLDERNAVLARERIGGLFLEVVA